MDDKDKPTKPKTEIDLSDLMPRRDAKGGAGPARGGAGNKSAK